MENIKIALITTDREYGKALGLALVDVYRNFTVTLFQSVPVHSEIERMDLILHDNSMESNAAGKHILLVEKQSQIDKNYDDNIYKLYKYSNVKSLAADLLLIYSSLTGRKAVPMRNSNAKIILFGAVEGGAGCTSAAIAFAREMVRFYNKKVLYISLEEMESTIEFTGEGHASKNISEYLYYLFNSEDDQHFPFIESFLVADKYGVDMFMPSTGRNVINSLSKDEMQYFMNAAMDTGSYDIAVIDASVNLGKAAQTCYEMANNICMVLREGSMNLKEQRFIDYFTFVKGEKVLERMGKVVSFSDGADKAKSDEFLKIVCVLPYEPESFSASYGIREINQDRQYGQQIHRLAEAVIRNVIL